MNRCGSTQLAYRHQPAQNHGLYNVVQIISITVQKAKSLAGPQWCQQTSFYMIVGLVRAVPAPSASTPARPWSLAHTQALAPGLELFTARGSIFRKLSVADNVRAVLELQRDETVNRSKQCKLNSVLTFCSRSAHRACVTPAPALSGGSLQARWRLPMR